MADRKFAKQGKRKAKRTSAGLREEEGPSHQIRGSREPDRGPQSQRERRVGTPEAGRKAELDLQVRERRGLNSRGGKDEGAGSRDPRGRAVRPASRLRPRGAGRGRIRAGRAAPPPVYLSPVHGVTSFPTLRS